MFFLVNCFCSTLSAVRKVKHPENCTNRNQTKAKKPTILKLFFINFILIQIKHSDFQQEKEEWKLKKTCLLCFRIAIKKTIQRAKLPYFPERIKTIHRHNSVLDQKNG